MNAEHSTALTAACCEQLQIEEASLNQLLKLLRENRQAMLDRNVDKLLESARQLQAHQECAALTQRRRSQLRQRMGELWRIPPEEVTISRCLQHCDPDARARLSDLQRRLQGTVQAMQALVQGNVMMAKQFSIMIDQTVQTLSGKPVTPRYGASGQLDRSQAMNVLEKSL